MLELQFTFKKTIEKNVRVIIGQFIHQHINQYIQNMKFDKVFIISDKLVAKIYGQKITSIISYKYPTFLIKHSPFEKGKNFKSFEKIITQFFNYGGTSKSGIIALGGGTTGNIAGLAASVIYRGIRLVHIPTTLLSQLDSAPDVKNSINTPWVKNAIGTYKPPDLVIIDPFFLKTLKIREIRSGIAEAVKHGFAQDLKFIEFIASSSEKNKFRNIEILEKIIQRTIYLKIEHWKKTPSKWNEPIKIERLTHLGHTVGKILEIIDLDYLTHGEAISHGMVIEAYISFLLGLLDIKSVSCIKKTLEKLHLLYPLNQKYTIKKILNLLYFSDSDPPIFALLRKLGNPNTISTTVPKITMKKSLEWYFKEK